MRVWPILAGVVVVATIANWPAIQGAKANWGTDREAARAAQHERIQDFVAMRKELGMASPFPPGELLDKQQAESYKLGGGGRMYEGVVSALGPSSMEASAKYSGAARCREATRALGRNKNVRILVNGKSAHRLEAWKLCVPGANLVVARVG